MTLARALCRPCHLCLDPVPDLRLCGILERTRDEELKGWERTNAVEANDSTGTTMSERTVELRSKGEQRQHT
jgi:hypothetical protein